MTIGVLSMKRIMFVCHGNICRSPMAEFILKRMVKKSGAEKNFVIESSATSTEEIWDGIGNPVYPPAKEELAKHGVSCEGKHAVQLVRSDYDKYDLIICMDSKNIQNALHILGGDSCGKVKKLLSYTGSTGDVSDPWYSGDFRKAYDDIFQGCSSLMKELIEKL